MVRWFSVLTPLFLALAAVAGAADDGWTLIRSRDGIDTYEKTRTEDGYREYKGVVRLEASLEETADTIRDVPGSIDWLPDCRHSETLRRIGDDELLVYIISNAPWPIKDRDVVWKRHYVADTDDHFLLRFQATEEPHTGEPGLIRMTNAHGAWEIKKLGAGSIEVSFRFVGDGGGSVPRAFVNGNNKSLPYKVLRALERRVIDLRRGPG